MKKQMSYEERLKLTNEKITLSSYRRYVWKMMVKPVKLFLLLVYLLFCLMYSLYNRIACFRCFRSIDHDFLKYPEERWGYLKLTANLHKVQEGLLFEKWPQEIKGDSLEIGGWDGVVS